MASRPLHPDVMLSIDLSAIMSRNKYTDEPGPVIAELRETAGERVDVLAVEAGTWAGFHESNVHCARLVSALKLIPGAADHVQAGRDRFQASTHRTPGRTKRPSP